MKLRLSLTERQACIVANALRVAEREMRDEAARQFNYGDSETGLLRVGEATDAADVLRRINDYVIALDNMARNASDPHR